MFKNKSKTYRCLIASLACCTALGGCGSQLRSPDTIQVDRLAFNDYPQIVMLDRTRLDAVLHDRPTAGIEDSGVYQVRVPLRSIASKTISYRYRFVYFNAQGIELDRDTWSSKTVPARSAFQITGKSVLDGVSEWRLEIGLLYGLKGNP